VYMHRILTGAAMGELVDHQDGDGLNNQRANLRVCTSRQNSRNKTCSRPNRKAPFKGIYWHGKRQRWCARIAAGKQREDGTSKVIVLGYFVSPEEAAAAYDKAALEHFGEFAQVNFQAESAA
jgi:hypothetical protein